MRPLTHREVLDGLSAGVVVARHDEITTHVNPAACRMLRAAASACLGQPVQLLLGISASLRDHGLDELDSECRLELNLPVGPAGATLQNLGGRGFVCVFRPFDEGRLADPRLLRMEREAAIDAIVAAFAHEVRNPLAALTAASEMLHAELPPGASEGSLAIIQRQVRRLTALARAPIALARSSAVQRVLCTVEHLVADAIAAVSAEARRCGVRIEVSLEPGLPRVSVGERELVDALAEVLENAVHASPSGAAVAVGARLLPAAPDVPPRAAIEITDRGVGLSPAELVESLRPFTTSKVNAAGTGLALAHRHIVGSGGRLAIETAPGGGLVVRIELSTEELR
ncbi:MAG TPA: ATP-binding protein [Kofleriaceae bacterium]|nr:ATP-binding protein [Kofleriaceae bacterium]